MNLPPQRVLLDTNIVNFVLDHDGCIFEGEPIPHDVGALDALDIDGLRGIFATGQRAQWEMAISPATHRELCATSDPDRRDRLQRLFNEFWWYWRDTVEADETIDDAHAADLARRLAPSSLLSAFPDAADRELICHAIAYGCDALCTRDRRSMLRRVDRAPALSVSLLSPAEWWKRIEPYAALY